jgi:MFS family permease
MAAANVLVPAMKKRLRAPMILALACVVLFAGILSLALTHSVILFMFAGAAFGLSNGVCSPLLYAMAVEDLPAWRRGVGGSTLFVMLDLGMGGGAFVWGLMIKYAGGYNVMYICAAATQILAAILSFVLPRKRGGIRPNR